MGKPCTWCGAQSGVFRAWWYRPGGTYGTKVKETLCEDCAVAAATATDPPRGTQMASWAVQQRQKAAREAREARIREFQEAQLHIPGTEDL